MRYVDDFSVDEVALALGAISWSAKAESMVRALATAPNRALSRLELARSVGSDDPQTCNGVLGHFGRKLAIALDDALLEEWKPQAGGEGGGDWVMFLNYGVGRWTTPSNNEPDDWVFIMSDVLARALDSIGFAPFRELDADANTVLDARDGPIGHDLSDPHDDIDDAEEQLADLSETEREAVVRARLGQGVFRQSLIDAWEGQCAVTGSSFTPALVASHIKPWRDCTNIERLDPDNGLLLVATLDRLFDAGYITFEADGSIRISPELPPSEFPALQLTSGSRLRHVPVSSLPYLEAHRQTCFRAAD